jgi:hypothetical protein
MQRRLANFDDRQLIEAVGSTILRHLAGRAGGGRRAA